MIKIQSSVTDSLLKSLDLLRPDISTQGNRHIITYKGNKFEIPLSIQASKRSGNQR